MKQLTKYLAIFLLVVFAAPETYRNIHILHHRTAAKQVDPDLKHRFEISNPGTGICIICSFEFPFSDIPYFFFYQLFIGLILVLSLKTISSENRRFTGYHFSLRAPPIDS
jgi:hypothetical protein